MKSKSKKTEEENAYKYNFWYLLIGLVFFPASIFIEARVLLAVFQDILTSGFVFNHAIKILFRIAWLTVYGIALYTYIHCYLFQKVIVDEKGVAL